MPSWNAQVGSCHTDLLAVMCRAGIIVLQTSDLHRVCTELDHRLLSTINDHTTAHLVWWTSHLFLSLLYICWWHFPFIFYTSCEYLCCTQNSLRHVNKTWMRYLHLVSLQINELLVHNYWYSSRMECRLICKWLLYYREAQACCSVFSIAASTSQHSFSFVKRALIFYIFFRMFKI